MMCLSMLGITLALTAAGFWQIILQRLPESGDALGFMETQSHITPVYWVREILGVVFALGLVAYFVSFFVGRTEMVSHSIDDNDMTVACLESNV